MTDEKEKKLVPVRVVEQRGKSAVVEWVDGEGPHRAVIPAPKGELVEEESLAMGIPYGLPWESIAALTATGERLARALRERGIWTLADLEKNQPAAFGAIQSVYGVDLAALIAAAERAAQGE